MKKLKENKGFTLIELLLVVVIIGLMLAVIVPRAWRANIDAKYGIVRHNCSELASWASDWAETMILAQDEISTVAQPDLDDYFGTLAAGSGAGTSPSYWVANTTANNNWNNNGGPGAVVTGGLANRRIGNSAPSPIVEAAVEDHVPPDKTARNPFNGVSVFDVPNDPQTTGTPVTGAIACGVQTDGSGGSNWNYYALCFAGTDSTTNNGGADAAYHAGQTTMTLGGLRNGIFMARLR